MVTKKTTAKKPLATTPAKSEPSTLKVENSIDTESQALARLATTSWIYLT